ncbi:hypothetical protein IFR05_007670 [Cadophora sp. M221]|nr:hypothetical protein IFR05_007670 [Cadophora sp. M221]
MAAKIIEFSEEKVKTVERFHAVLNQVAILRQCKDTEAEGLMAEAERQIALQREKNLESDMAELYTLRAEAQTMTAEREEFKELQRKLENAENVFKEKNDALYQVKEVTLGKAALEEKLIALEEKLQNMSVNSLEEAILRSKLDEAEKFKRERDDFMSLPQETVDNKGVILSSVILNLKARKREVLEILRWINLNDPILAVYISRLDKDAQKSEHLPFDCFGNYSDPKVSEIAALGRDQRKQVSFALAHLAARSVVLEHRRVGLFRMQHIKFYNDQDKNGRHAIIKRLVDYYDTRFHFQIKLLTRATSLQYDTLIVSSNEDTIELEHNLDVRPYKYSALLTLNKQTYDSMK